MLAQPGSLHKESLTTKLNFNFFPSFFGQKVKLMRGLASIQVPWILGHLLEVARNSSVIRSQDYFTLLTYIAWNRVGEPIVWDFVRNQWDYLVDRFTLNDRLFGRFLHTMTKRFATPLRLKEMKDFFSAHPEAGAGENYRKIALETVEGNVKFVQQKLPDIKHWLSQKANLKDG